jgi:methionyl-tRNA formyltransferase
VKIIFMGTPRFAVPALKRLIQSNTHQITAVFTASPKAQGRGLETTKSPVHQLALQYNIPVYNPVTLKTGESVDLISSLEADIIIVIAYGFIIPKTILNLKKYGCLNIHPSNLPKYRGAAPLQRAIINGENENSVCIMQMDEGLDTGDIILQEKFSMSKRITLHELHDRCAILGGELLLKALDKIDILPRIKQSETGVSYAHKLSKEEGKINWHESAYAIDCKIRGMNPWPGTYFEYNGKIIKILEATYDELDHKSAPGTVMQVDDQRLKIACGKGCLLIEKLQQQGKKILSATEFLFGTNIPIGTIMTNNA